MNSPARILRLPEVKNRTGLSRAVIYRLAAQGKFPKRVKLTARASGWFESEVAEWIGARRIDPAAKSPILKPAA